MRKKLGIAVLMAGVFGVIMLSCIVGEKLLRVMEQRRSIPTTAQTEEKKIVLDSGHGGFDPGKVGANEIQEKDINLQIAQKIQKILGDKGIHVIMTREEDISLGESKSEDLKARVDLINQERPALVVSIHQNSYPDAEIHGAQVFYYSHSPEGENVAKILQESLGKTDPGNQRQAKENDTYYMLKKTEYPIVIVECGFLSNPREAEMLCKEEYQEKIAHAVTEGILQYIK